MGVPIVLSHADSVAAARSDSVIKASMKDSLVIHIDSLTGKRDTTIIKASSLMKVDSLNEANSEIKDKITYKALDSIVYDISAKKMYLYNGAETHYQKIQLNADAIEFDWTTMEMMAQGAKDSTGEISGKPIFKDDGKEYRAGKMRYNFKNQHGKVYEVSTNEGDAYLHSEAVKRADSTSWFGYKSKYTTCNLDHPHFYFKAKKIKLVPGKIMVTGPANLWIADVPTPLYIPFGIFPIKQGRRSGIIVPKYGNDAQNGFFLRDGGYYWAASDNFGLKVIGTIYTNGTFEINPSINYKWNYKFSGSLAVGYIRTRPADPDLPDQKSSNAFKVAWNFQLDPKAAPTHTFSAAVNVSTASYNQDHRVTDQSLYQTSLYSNINYQKSFTRAPFLSLSLSASHSQNLQNRQISVTLPEFRLNVSRVTPFKAKISTGKPKWYENIGILYGFQVKNTINTLDTLITRPDFYKSLRYGINQNAAIDAPFTIAKFLNVTPNLTYTERWYFQTVNESWVNKDQVNVLPGGFTTVIPGGASYLQTDTLYGFKAARDFAANLNLSTKVTGIYNFKGKYVKAIRHILTPQVGVSYHPDFGSAYWGYYANVRKNLFDPTVSQYSHFDIVNGVYGQPQSGKYAVLNWSLNNNFDMKVFSKKDSVTHERKIGILDRFNISGGYNFALDSLQLQPFVINGSMKLWDNINATFAVTMDPYALGTNGRTINRFYYDVTHKGLLRFTSANLSVNATFHGKAKPTALPPLNKAQHMVADYVSYNPDDYYDFDVPWNLTASYSLDLRTSFQTYTQHDSLLFTQYLKVNGDFNLTAKWKIAVNTGFDFARKELTVTQIKVVRSLHCWELDFDWTAWPLNYQQFAIELKIINPTLQDLKLTKKRTAYSP
ncbi:MAG: organic solvent tolerance protein OstA [Bacteroidetes bacterium]|nr:organic solvent tolerance protein OstA [Bacteroidota bacterium]